MERNLGDMLPSGMTAMCRLRRSLRAVGIGLALAFSLSAFAADAPDGCKLLRLAGPTEYPPLSWGNEHRLQGAGYDLAALVAERVGIKAKIVPVGSWPRTFARVVAGEVDMLVSLYRLSERERGLLYLPAWAQEHTIVVMDRDRPFGFHRWEDLIGRPGASSRGDSSGEQFDSFAKDKLHIVRTPTQANMFNMLEAGRVDYVVVGEYSPYAPEFRNSGSTFVVAETPIGAHDVHMAMSRKSPCAALVPQLSEALNRLVADGTAARLVEQYAQRYAGTSSR